MPPPYSLPPGASGRSQALSTAHTLAADECGLDEASMFAKGKVAGVRSVGSAMIDFHAYCDESYVTASRFRGIACVSLPEVHCDGLAKRLAESLVDAGLRELKWSETGDGRHARAARRFIDAAFNAFACGLRIDVLVWDTQDARHAVPGRDDNANYERMFFHLLTVALRKRPTGSVWRIGCDQREGVDWQALFDCVRAVGRRPDSQAALFGEFLAREKYIVREVAELRSQTATLVQLADLFAGVSVFSRSRYDFYEAWKMRESKQGRLFAGAERRFSKSDQERFPILDGLNERGKAAKLRLSLRRNRGLRTMDGRQAVNVWWYEPQHGMDKAPKRRGP